MRELSQNAYVDMEERFHFKADTGCISVRERTLVSSSFLMLYYFVAVLSCVVNHQI